MAEAAPAGRRLVALREFGPPSVMEWVDGPVPPSGPGDVTIAVEAIGVNFGDTMVRRGEYRRDQPLTFIPGFEVAGRVIDGPADGPAPGDTVVGFTADGGGYADTVVVPRDHALAVADGISPVTAAAIFTQGVTAWYAVHRYGRVQAGESVLIHGGAGGLGSLSIQLCAALGARVVATASTPERRELARGHGAADALDPDPASLAAAVRELTDGRGVDAVIDGVGGALFGPSMRALAFNGRYVVVGSASQEPASLDVRGLMPRGQTIAGFVVARVMDMDPAEPQRAFDAVQAAFLDGTLRPQIQVMSPDQVVDAHELIESRRLTGKVVLSLTD